MGWILSVHLKAVPGVGSDSGVTGVNFPHCIVVSPNSSIVGARMCLSIPSHNLKHIRHLNTHLDLPLLLSGSLLSGLWP